MLRYCWFAVAVLLPLAAFGDDQPPPGNMLSPSFTWGEVPPATGNAGLSGVYRWLGMVKGTSIAGGRYHLVAYAKHTYWCFFPDGRCYYSMPAKGLDNFNYDYVRPMNELRCCTYELAGDRGVITWGTGGTTVPFRRVGKTLLIKTDTDVYELLDPCNGLKLEGIFKRDNWQEENSFKKGVTFSRDGDRQRPDAVEVLLDEQTHASDDQADPEPQKRAQLEAHREELAASRAQRNRGLVRGKDALGHQPLHCLRDLGLHLGRLAREERAAVP